MSINEPKTLFMLCGILIFSDVITGYIKAFKFKKVNSSISRDGFIKKISWIFALVLGFAIDYFVKVNIFLMGSALVCVTTEEIPVYENFVELGIKLKFYFYKFIKRYGVRKITISFYFIISFAETSYFKHISYKNEV